MTGNIYMELLYENELNGLRYFEFSYDKMYELVQGEYNEKCRSLIHENISFLLQSHPYHIDTLLTMSNILLRTNNLEESSDLIERALYRLQCVLHSKFNLIYPTNRLNYLNKKNKSFYLCLWKYSQNIGKKGCVNSAFELTKSLLNLSPKIDPLCCLLSLDYWAMRSNKLIWIIKFIKSFFVCHDINDKNINSQNFNSLRTLPNWCYNTALAKFKYEIKQKYDGIIYGNNNKCDDGKIPIDLFQIDDEFKISSSILLQQAILLFPEVIFPLIKKIDKNLINKNEWKIIMKHKLFINGKIRRNKNMIINKLIKIFIERSHSLWKGNDIINWLLIHCQFVINRIDKIEKDDENENELMIFDGIRDSIYDDELMKNKYKFLDINDFSNVITTLPMDELRNNGIFNGLPNENDIENLINNIRFNRGNRNDIPEIIEQLRGLGIQLPNDIQREIVQGQNLQEQNPLSAFFYSMMPWVNPINAQNNNNNNENNENKENNEIDDDENEDQNQLNENNENKDSNE